MTYQDILDIVASLIPTISAVITGLCVIVKVIGMIKDSKEDTATQIKDFLGNVEQKRTAELEEQKKIIAAQQRTIEMQNQNIEQLTRDCRKIIDHVED